MSNRIRVLLVEDSEDDALLLLDELEQGGYDPIHMRVDTAAAMTAALASQQWDIILSDYEMPEFSGPDALKTLKETGLDLPFIIVSGKIGEETAVAAMKAGAHDYIMKSNLTRLVPAIDRELREAVERRTRREAEKILRANQEEFRIAREIQQGLFPHSAPELPGFDIAGASYPAAATGGDYFDFIPMQDGCLGIAIGDVSGHGLGPALLMAETRACLRTLALTFKDVSEILNKANRLLGKDSAEKRFVTLVLARLCARSRTFVYESAGHTTCYVLDPAGAIKTSLLSTGFPLGLDAGRDFPAAAPIGLLSPGDLILFLTDGVTEARPCDSKAPISEALFGIERALAVVRANRHKKAKEIVDSLYQAIREFSQQRPLADDVTVVVVKVTEDA
jgi:serine phosphatase RsbU (regulator of sigma subunit)